MADTATLASVTITAFLVIVLARAAWHKLDHFPETIGFAQGYGLVPEAAAAPIVRGLTVAEIATVGALLVPATRPLGGLAAALLFAGYGGLMALALANGRGRIECGCGGAPQIVSALTLTRNAVLAGLGLAVALLPATTVPPLGAAIAIVAALVLAAQYGVAEKLGSHLPHIREGGR
ncbi:MauE/DoxX family redox-associated membrane protein [Amaricoccus solimangrovi]|uniref:Methylamine utilization protein MauE n=1 Tax=Amaricoccus solimangrovi TaxID=2589815 RepID=A0A501WVG3_9RHOB|nr:MauE/DoxX family redox-associated membrane protein [Amaricoccus solimangrovi]TPE53269.1 hypothetical protein FJM51_04425 [Amaricoccus solimangrovi]